MTQPADGIKVTFGAIDALAGQVDAQVKKIETQLEDLRQAINKLASEWTGASQDSFRQVQNNWNQSATDLNGVLNRIAVAVHQAHDSYQHTENQNAAVWG